MNDFDSTNLECPHCGESFYYELTRCPNCGRNVYPSDYDDYEEEEEGEKEEEGWGVHPERFQPEHPQITSQLAPAVWSLFLGWFVSGILGILLFVILNVITSGISSTSWLRYLPLLSVPLGAFVGGLTAGKVNEDHPFLSGTLVGILSISMAILITAYEHDLATEPLFRPETIPWWGLTILAGWGGAALSGRHTERQTLRQLFNPRTENDLYQDLLTKVQFDHLTAESLIEYERKRTPHSLRLEWIQNAIDRWERDNRV